LQYPVPWASVQETSALATPDDYRDALESAGFTLTAERDRRDVALDVFANLRARTMGAGGPASLGLHLLMGDTTSLEIANMVAGISNGTLATVELVTRKAV
jgi:hypothetical protein